MRLSDLEAVMITFLCDLDLQDNQVKRYYKKDIVTHIQ